MMKRKSKGIPAGGPLCIQLSEVAVDNRSVEPLDSCLECADDAFDNLVVGSVSLVAVAVVADRRLSTGRPHPVVNSERACVERALEAYLCRDFGLEEGVEFAPALLEPLAEGRVLDQQRRPDVSQRAASVSGLAIFGVVPGGV